MLVAQRLKEYGDGAGGFLPCLPVYMRNPFHGVRVAGAVLEMPARKDVVGEEGPP